MRSFAILVLSVSLWALPAAARERHHGDHGRQPGHELQADRVADLAQQLERAAPPVAARARAS